MSGCATYFRDLSLAMGRSQPFYGLQARGIDGILRPHETIEEMATAYLPEVRALQPHGPYVFGGYSGGGLVAFEMAQQDRSQGDDVGLIVLLDTFPPTIAHRKTTLKSTFERLHHGAFGYIKHIFGRRVEMRRRARMRARLDEILAANGVVPGELRDIHLNDAFGDAAAKYTRQPWRGRVVLLRATDVAFAFEGIGDAYGWDEVVEDGFIAGSGAGQPRHAGARAQRVAAGRPHPQHPRVATWSAAAARALGRCGRHLGGIVPGIQDATRPEATREKASGPLRERPAGVLLAAPTGFEPVPPP